MRKKLFNFKSKNTLFILQVTESALKLVSCVSGHGGKREFSAIEVKAIPVDIDDKQLIQELSEVLKKLEYNNNPIVVSLPRHNATCRYIKIPAQTAAEIEKITLLQAPRYLPYPPNELITAYQVILTDKGGYTHVNLIIAHKDAIQRYIRVFQALNIKKFSVVLSPFGLCNLYRYLNPKENQPVMLIDIDLPITEAVIVSGGKTLFSRSFKVIQRQENWPDLFIEEINKTVNAYLKEATGQTPIRAIIFGSPNNSQGFADIISEHLHLPVEAVSYKEGLPAGEAFLSGIFKTDNSLAGLMGLALEEIPESLSLLPKDVKDSFKRTSRKAERLRLILLICGIILLSALGAAKTLDNKARYLQRIKIEVNKIAKEAQALEEIDKRSKILERRSKNRLSSLDTLYELHKIMPSEISLASFNYDEEEGQVVLRGQTPELNSVFTLVARLEKAAAFRNLNIRVRYATKKKLQSGEVVDFEIVCSKR